MKPSEQIKAHIRGTGSGYDLDDLLTRNTGGVYETISDRIREIHLKFRTREFPIGISNPMSFTELEALAAELEESGL